MPIRPENRDRYPFDWPLISFGIRKDRAGDRCECTGGCGHDHGGRCIERNGETNTVTGSIVWLTVAHLDDMPEHNDPEDLKAKCQRCHLNYDRHIHVANFVMNWSQRRIAASMNRELFADADFGGATRHAALLARPPLVLVKYADALASRIPNP